MDIRAILDKLDLLDLLALAEAILLDPDAVYHEINGIAVHIDERIEQQYEQWEYEQAVQAGLGWEF